MAEQFSDRKSTRLNSSHGYISYAVFCLKKKMTGLLFGSRDIRRFFDSVIDTTATAAIYTLSLHDALPILDKGVDLNDGGGDGQTPLHCAVINGQLETVKLLLELNPPLEATNIYGGTVLRSEEHTSELQSRLHLVCRLLLEKKNDWPFIWIKRYTPIL